MAIINFFSKEEPTGAEPQLQDRNVILAYMEDLAKTRALLHLWFREADRVPLAAQILEVDDKLLRIKLRLHRALPSDIQVKQKVTLVFPMEGSRFLAPMRFLNRGQYLEAWFTLPESVIHAERRTKLRTHFSPREKATVTVLQDLHDQFGATGPLLDLSMEGLCMRLERVIAIGDKVPVPASSGMFPPGTLFPIIRVEQLPFAPSVECSGVVAHIRDSDDGVIQGIRFLGLGELENQIVNQVMGRRLPRFSQGFPIRHRLQPGAAPPAQAAPALALDPALLLAIERLETCDWPEPEERTEEEAREDRRNRLLRMKKKPKRLLLVMFDDLDRAILAGTLKVDGYDKVLEARNYLEALAHGKVQGLDLVIIEQQLGTHSAQAFLEKLRKQGVCVDVPVVLLAGQLDVRVKLMAKAAHIDHLQQVPIDFDGELGAVLARLLKLE
jgi:CheY-like chemotaxis protein